MMMKKNRLDHHLVEKGFFKSRAAAQHAIKDGHVIVGGLTALKAASKVAMDCVVEIAPDHHGFVSRGGVKLAHAIHYFNIQVSNKICLDVGASTGGFCDVLLQNNAAKIYAVDVGHGQLHPTIAVNPKIINLEKTNSKTLSRELISEPPDIIVCDVSFISLTKALPKALDLLKPDGCIISLLKPQFELGPERIGKGGIVNANEAEMSALKDEIYQWFLGYGFKGPIGYDSAIIDSPIKGGDGNREFLLCMDKVKL